MGHCEWLSKELGLQPEDGGELLMGVLTGYSGGGEQEQKVQSHFLPSRGLLQ